MSIYKKPEQTVIAICGPSTSGKTTIVNRLLEKLGEKKDYVTVISLDDYFYPDWQKPTTLMLGRNVLNLDLKESIDWDSFYKAIANAYTPIVILDGFIIFADQRSYQVVDVCVSLEYGTYRDFDIALERRVKKSRRFGSERVPSNYLQNTWSNDLCYYCSYFHEIVWPEMKKHPEYRYPVNWSKPILTLSAKSDINLNVMKTYNFIYQHISSYFD